MGYQFIRVEDNIWVETGKVAGLTYSKKTDEYIQNKHRVFLWLRVGEKWSVLMMRRRMALRGVTIEDNSQKAMKGNGSYGTVTICCSVRT
jgi:hypothetical protein